MPKTNNVKSRHRFLIPNKYNFCVHEVARPVYQVWLNCRVGHKHINLSGVDDYHKPPIRLIETKTGFQYYYAFERMQNIMQFEANDRQPFIISEHKSWHIKKMAWAEVLQLAFIRDVNHALLWHTLKSDCPTTILLELMQTASLTRKDYTEFVGIELDHLEYQQRQIVAQQESLGLPNDMSWANESSE